MATEIVWMIVIVDGLWFVSLVVPAVIAFGVCSNCENNNSFTDLCFPLTRAHVHFHQCPILSLFVRVSGLISSRTVRASGPRLSCLFRALVAGIMYVMYACDTSIVGLRDAAPLGITMTGWFSPHGCAGVLVD